MDAITRLQRKWDREAVTQLRAEVTRLANRITELEDQLSLAEFTADMAQLDADFYRDMAPYSGLEVGITQQGQLVAINGSLHTENQP